MSFKIVVMSCDKNDDLWYPFYHCMEKYWNDHPEIIYSTETKPNPYYKTISVDLPLEKWTKRVYETVKNLPCKHILLMVDDIFIRQKVSNNLIYFLTTYVCGSVAALNFEFSFDKYDIPLNGTIKMRNPNGKYKVSCMCQMWSKKALLDLFNCEYDAWTFEKKNNAKYYEFLISCSGNFIDWGKRHNTWKWGVVKGKWTKECKEFFDKEGIIIDYDKRGFTCE